MFHSNDLLFIGGVAFSMSHEFLLGRDLFGAGRRGLGVFLLVREGNGVGRVQKAFVGGGEVIFVLDKDIVSGSFGSANAVGANDRHGE